MEIPLSETVFVIYLIGGLLYYFYFWTIICEKENKTEEGVYLWIMVLIGWLIIPFWLPILFLQLIHWYTRSYPERNCK